MKSTFKILSICLALLVVFCACANETEKTDNTQTPPITNDDKNPTQSATPDDTTSKPDEPTDPEFPEKPEDKDDPTTSIDPVEPTDRVPDKGNSILSSLQSWGENINLFATNHAELTNINELYRLGNNLLAVSGGYDFEAKSVYARLSLISIENGQILARNNMMGAAEYHLQICENKAVFHDNTNGKITVFDSELKAITDYKYSAKQVYFDTKCEKAYTFTDKGIIITNLAINMDKRVNREYHDIRVMEDNGYLVTISYIDTADMLEHYGVFNLDSGELAKIETQYPAQKIESNGILTAAQLTGKSGTNLLINTAGTKVYSQSGFAQTLLVGDKIFEASYNSKGDPQIFVYDEKGGFVSTCIVTDADWMGLQCDPVWFPEYNGYFFALSGLDGKGRILFWDMSKEVKGDGLKLEEISSLDLPAGDALAQKHYDRAESIGEKYGLTILIADQCEKELGNYKIGNRAHSESAVTAALDGLEKALSNFPEGFFKKLMFGQNHSIEIQLFSGQISHKETGSTYAGFVYEDAGKFVMGLDARHPDIATHIMEQTVYHEFSHIIDKRLEFGSKHSDTPSYSEEGWLALNPASFKYTGDGDAVAGAVRGYESFFVDDYACTDSGEDRARVFEYAMMAALHPENKYTKYFDSSHLGLKSKLEYYRACIRTQLGTDWTDTPLWEKIG